MKTILTITCVFFAITAIAKSEIEYSQFSEETFTLAADSTDTCDTYTMHITDSLHDVGQTIDCFIYTKVIGGFPPYTYVWTGPNGHTSSLSYIDPLYNGGTYFVTVTDSLSCTKEETFIVPCYTSVNDVEVNADILIQPNPAKGEVQIYSTELTPGIYTLELKNILGREILTEQVSIGSTLEKYLDLSSVQSGMYFLLLTDAKGKSHLQRLVVK